MRSEEKQKLQIYLSLINTVKNNCENIIELELLECLLNMIEENENCKNHILFLKEVINQTHCAHYARGAKLDSLTLRVELVLPELMAVYGKFEDDIEFKSLNDFYSNLTVVKQIG